MPLTTEEQARVDQLVEESKNDNTIIVGSDIRELATLIKKLQDEAKKTRVTLDFYNAIQSGVQQAHHNTNRIYEAAVKAGLTYRVGACGNGGIPTWEAITDKIIEAFEKHGSKSV